MATMSWGTAKEYTRIATLTPLQAKTIKHEVGKIYTEVHSYYRVSLTSQTLTSKQLSDAVARIQKELAGKATLLWLKVDSTTKRITYQYIVTAGFFAQIVVAAIIIAAMLIVAYIILTLLGVDVGSSVAKAVTAPVTGMVKDILTSPWVIGGLLVAGGGYFLLKNPSKIGEIRREFRRETYG